MSDVNLIFGWCWVLVGLLTGVPIGMAFHRADWLGGYGAWRRRLVRLGHIAFIGTGVLNILLALTVQTRAVAPRMHGWAGVLMIAGAVAMPTVCALAAWRPGMRRWFFVPVLCLIGGTALVVVGLVIG